MSLELSWLLLCAALVIFMTPGLAFFYGGLVKTQSVLSMMMHSFGSIVVVALLYTLVGAGIGNPSPALLSVLRKSPNGGQVTIRVDLDEAVRDPRQNILVAAGDILILQEMPDQAMSRYVTQVFQLNFFGRFINRNDAQGSVSAVAP